MGVRLVVLALACLPLLAGCGEDTAVEADPAGTPYDGPMFVELDYRDSVAVAFKEMRDALGAYSEASLTLQSAQRRSQALVRAAELTRSRYDGGQSSRLDVIDAERLALTAQAQSADAARALTESQANVFRALGGGWKVSSSR